ncbi:MULTISPECIES: fimbrial protein [unclassified Providencia]|uniref:fimbrial protein n=1 Tax=unclassified Providencia TaxID=2633465 RepID=UPI0023492B02|nr:MULTISPECIES: fimbrial protein [unclassified Providencia]
MTLKTSFRTNLIKFSVFVIINFLLLSKSFGSTVSFKALISNSVGLGCKVIIPNNVLSFTPLKSNIVVGNIKTFQINPLVIRLSCVDETEELLPLLTISGVTPYQDDTTKSIFLDGNTNGVGFMIRQSIDNQQISLNDFYKPTEAIQNNGTPKQLSKLNSINAYQSETLLWVGLVGPLRTVVTPGNFSATLTVNVAFQ